MGMGLVLIKTVLVPWVSDIGGMIKPLNLMDLAQLDLTVEGL